jgi:hypothetical protein
MRSGVRTLRPGTGALARPRRQRLLPVFAIRVVRPRRSTGRRACGFERFATGRLLAAREPRGAGRALDLTGTRAGDRP